MSAALVNALRAASLRAAAVALAVVSLALRLLRLALKALLAVVAASALLSGSPASSLPVIAAAAAALGGTCIAVALVSRAQCAVDGAAERCSERLGCARLLQSAMEEKDAGPSRNPTLEAERSRAGGTWTMTARGARSPVRGDDASAPTIQK